MLFDQYEIKAYYESKIEQYEKEAEELNLKKIKKGLFSFFF